MAVPGTRRWRRRGGADVVTTPAVAAASALVLVAFPSCCSAEGAGRAIAAAAATVACSTAASATGRCDREPDLRGTGEDMEANILLQIPSLQRAAFHKDVPNVSEDVRRQFLAAPFEFKESLVGEHMDGAGALKQPQHATCALVSSSANLLDVMAGQRIDAVDGIVARFNGAPTKGFEPHVGSRTDVMIINDVIPCKWYYGKPTEGLPPKWDVAGTGVRHVVVNDFGGSPNLHKRCVEWMVRSFPNVSFGAVDFVSLHNAIFELMNEIAANASTAAATLPTSLSALADAVVQAESGVPLPWITTGMVGAALLAKVCSKVQFFGFMPTTDANANLCREHYWDKPDGKCATDGWHKLNLEHALWQTILIPGESPGEGTLVTGSG